MEPPRVPRQPVRQEWKWFLGRLTQSAAGGLTTLEVVGPEVGTQVEADRLPLDDITYDDREETIVVSLREAHGDGIALRRIIENPWTIIFDPPLPEDVHTLDIEGGDGVHTLMTLHARPSPAEAVDPLP